MKNFYSICAYSISFFAILSIATVLVLLTSAPSHAASTIFSNSLTSDSNEAVPMVSRSGNGVTLDAPSALFKVSIPASMPQSTQFNIIVLNVCGTIAGYNSIGDTTVQARAYMHGVPGGIGAGIGPARNNTSNCSGNHMIFPVAASDFVSLPNEYGNFMLVALIEVTKTGAGGGIRSFRVHADQPQARVTYAETGNPSASGQPTGRAAVSMWNGQGPSFGNVGGRVSYYLSRTP